jgi:hypothetical protein
MSLGLREGSGKHKLVEDRQLPSTESSFDIVDLHDFQSS